MSAMKDNVVVRVNEGTVRGIKKTSPFSGVQYYSFFGIPYGQPTGGRARFRDPVKVKPWKDVLDATTEKEGCCQYSVYMHRIAGSEDCLFNNIYTPCLPNKGDPMKPVIVNIHPGGFYHGSPQTGYFGNPDYVMHRDIVYVCIAYRLHILGFLNLGLEECSGNQGLKDIILGLQWMKENIKVFGGDPNNITLLGSSSGSSIVHGLMLSPRAQSFFHKAVVMGVHNFSPNHKGDQHHKKEALELARAMGYNSTEEFDGKKLLAFYRKSMLPKIISFRPEVIFNKDVATIYPCCPFNISYDQGKNPVFPKDIYGLVDSTARIPLMFGVCERESAMGFSAPFIESMMKNFYTSYRTNVGAWGYNITDDEVEEIKEKIDSFYLNGEPLETAPLSLKIDIQTDIVNSNLYKTFIDIVSADMPSNVFVYKFEFDGNVRTMKDIVQPFLEERVDGTYHAADYSYWTHVDLYGRVLSNILTPQTIQMINTFTNLISTFARTGNPNYEGLNVEWKPTTLEKPCYLRIGDTLNMVDGKLNGERMEFWENIIEEYKK